MKYSTEMKTLSAALLLALGVSYAWAGSVTISKTWTAGDALNAADLNQNFSDVKTAVDDNNARLITIETTGANIIGVTAGAGLTGGGISGGTTILSLTGAASIHGAAFNFSPSQATESRLSTVGISQSSGVSKGAYGALTLPHGVTMKKMTCGVLNNTTTTFSAVLRKIAVTALGSGGTVFSTGAALANITTDQYLIDISATASLSVVDNVNAAYIVLVNLPSGSTLRGCSVTY